MIWAGSMGYYRKRSKRKLSPEQLQKMQEGRERAKAAREEAAKTKHRVEMLSDLDKQLARAKQAAERDNKYIKRTKRRHKTYK